MKVPESQTQLPAPAPAPGKSGCFPEPEAAPPGGFAALLHACGAPFAEEPGEEGEPPEGERNQEESGPSPDLPLPWLPPSLPLPWHRPQLPLSDSRAHPPPEAAPPALDDFPAFPLADHPQTGAQAPVPSTDLRLFGGREPTPRVISAPAALGFGLRETVSEAADGLPPLPEMRHGEPPMRERAVSSQTREGSQAGGDGVEKSGEAGPPRSDAATAGQPKAGTGHAQRENVMKNPGFQAKSAGWTEQNLPGEAESALPLGSKRSSLPEGAPPRESQTGVSQVIPVDFRRTPDHPTLLSPGVEKRDPIPTLAETLRNEAVFLREQKIETVSVVLRPDDQTELSISLLQRDGVIEATAHLRRGDFETLNRDWEQLQRELRESRVQLSDLTSSTGDGRQSHPGHSGPYTYYPLDEPAFPSFRTGASAPPEAAESKTSMAADPAHWERWA